MVTVLSAVVWLGCAYGGAPPRLLAFGAAGPLLVVLVLLGTCATNVSLHTSAAAAGVTQLTLLLDPRCVVLYGVVAAIAWSRLYLGAHTRGQVLAGAALGVAACAALAEFTR
nr:phosphatase PAP2 family protein [Streptomyces sp. HNM0574]